ncbi:uncharacterized protein [Haliotis cracherodii]|uniref:uncharacterized protein n=1 Tax=Haliotis cracherodii TaxID=6455 RepID=UPI0039E75F63
MSPLRAAILVFCLFVGVAVTQTQDGDTDGSNNVDEDLDETSCRATLQQALDAKNSQNKKGGNRKKRQINPHYPYGNVINNAYLRDTYSHQHHYNYNYDRRLLRFPSVPLLENRFDNLPIYRFFNSFTPAGTVRSTSRLVRNYARLNTNYADALYDFGVLPLVKVQEVRSSSVTRTVVQPDYVAEVFGIPGTEVRLMRNGCPLADYPHTAFPCLTLSINSSLPFGQVIRRFAYIPGFGFDNNMVVNGPFVAK